MYGNQVLFSPDVRLLPSDSGTDEVRDLGDGGRAQRVSRLL